MGEILLYPFYMTKNEKLIGCTGCYKLQKFKHGIESICAQLGE